MEVVKKFEVGRTYWCSWHEHLTLRVISRSEKTVTVRGWKITRHNIMIDSNGNEYFEIMDPFDGTFRYAANHAC